MGKLIQTPALVLIDIIISLFLFLLTYKALHGKSFTRSRIIFVYSLILLFCLFSFWGADWFGYQSYFELAKNSYYANIPMEEFYIWLVEKACGSYIVFRLVVWGSSIIFFCLTARNLRCNVGLILFFFCNIYLIYFSYARVTLAISMMFYGYSCLWTARNSKKILTIIWGLFWIFLSFFFHKSAILGISSIILAIFVERMGKISLKLLLVSFPIIVFLLNTFFSNYFTIIASSKGTFSEYANAGAGYLESSNSALGISTILSWMLERTPYYLLAFAAYMELLHPQIKHPPIIKAFFAVEFMLIFIASAFLFNIGVETSTLYGRFIRFAQIPSVFIFAYFFENKIVTRSVKWALYIGVFNCVYSLLYSFYNVSTTI